MSPVEESPLHEWGEVVEDDWQGRGDNTYLNPPVKTRSGGRWKEEVDRESK